MWNKGLENIQFIVNDINKMTLPSNYYDFVVCRWSSMLISDLDIILKNIYESLQKGGKFAAAVWAPSDCVPLISIPQSVPQTIRKEIAF
jgi:ubiquinone/menaquinone biosynthesis C-methylase UbiE